MTVGIAAMCDGGTGKKIVYCADRQVTTGILQFEGGTSKIEKITNNCYVIDTSNESLTSDLIIKKTKDRIGGVEFMQIQKIVDVLSEECVKMKNDEIQKDFLGTYQALIDNMKINPDKLLPYINQVIENYQYRLRCDFLVFGVEQEDIAHIFTVNQDGKSELNDKLAFATIGDGGPLALLEITKYPYSAETSAVESIGRVYFAKRLSQRATGVGNDMDLGLLYFPNVLENKESENQSEWPRIFEITQERPDIIEELENAFQDINQYEKKSIRDVMPKRLYDLLTNSNEEPKKQAEHKLQ